MSANEWTTCPRCRDNADAELAARVARVHGLYGIVSAETYLAEVNATSKRPER